ncbi:MAG: ParA family protein [bacterium]
MNIAIFNHKGGVGKSTLTSHLGFYAFENGYDTVVVDGDLQQCTISWLAGHAWSGDESYEKGTVMVTLNDIPYDNEFVIYDTNPNYDVIANLSNKIDKWIIPVDGRFSIESAIAVVEELRKFSKEQEIYVVANKSLNNKFGRGERKEIAKLGLKVFYLEIPQADVIRKAESMGLATWEVPYGGRSLATQNIELFCKWVFEGFNQKQLV